MGQSATAATVQPRPHRSLIFVRTVADGCARSNDHEHQSF